MRLLLISDDLTGALDSAVAFVQRGLSVICALDENAIPAAVAQDPDVLAVSINSREITEKQMKIRLSGVLDTIQGMPRWRDAVLFKKIDSRLKGHLRAEMSMLAFARPELLVCPAVPRLGRVVKDGYLQGAGVSAPLDIAGKLGLDRSHVTDAQNADDLNAALRDCNPATTLFVGAAGLADALACRMHPDVKPATLKPFSGSSVFAIGSRDPVTLDQLAPLNVTAAPNGAVPAIPSARLSVIQMTNKRAVPVAPEIAGAEFARGIAQFIKLHQPANLLACGGETAAAILRQLGARLLRVDAELQAGVPVSQLLDGYPGLRLISKSGGFGGPDTLAEIADMFRLPATNS
ncbi:MAG: hypothetical protein JJU08_06460 [Rhodobacteraceae bacterium]|nr:hypothetical protein [Paracoccaceae bacterium]